MMETKDQLRISIVLQFCLLLTWPGRKHTGRSLSHGSPAFCLRHSTVGSSLCKSVTSVCLALTWRHNKDVRDGVSLVESHPSKKRENASRYQRDENEDNIAATHRKISLLQTFPYQSIYHHFWSTWPYSYTKRESSWLEEECSRALAKSQFECLTTDSVY